MVDLLKVLLKAKSEEWGVAAKLIATSQDLEILANEKIPDLPVLKGWRKKLFGTDALRLKAGKIALSFGENGLKIINL
jgi:ribonuclease D